MKQLRYVSALILAMTASCSSVPKVPLAVKIIGDETINRDKQEHPLPVLVTIYELDDKQAFEEATFRQLWKQDVAVLGQSLLLKKEISLLPASTLKIKLKRQHNVKYIGIVARFRNANLGQWRAIKPVPYQATSLLATIQLHVSGNNIRVT